MASSPAPDVRRVLVIESDAQRRGVLLDALLPLAEAFTIASTAGFDGTSGDSGTVFVLGDGFSRETMVQLVETIRGGGAHAPIICLLESLKHGASDLIQSGVSEIALSQDLGTLAPTVERLCHETTARESASRSEQQLASFKALVDRLPIGVCLMKWENPPDPGSFRFTYWNAGARDASRPEPGFDLIGRYARDVPAQVEAGLPAVYIRAIETGEIQELPRIRYGDGRNFSAEVFDAKVARVDGQHVVALFENISARLAQEQQLRASQRMEVVGRLAGGVAHDYNNILTITMTHAHLLKSRAVAAQSSADPAMIASIDEILTSAQRASALTHQLLGFGRRQVQQLENVCVNDVVLELAKMVGRVLAEDIEVQTQLAPDLGLTRIDRSQFEQVLMNLIVNARDAMPGGGTLTIETANVFLDERYWAEKGVAGPATSYVQITVADTGIGMDVETQREIFEPFFTTKGPDKGTGLGLSTAYGIVKQSDGFLWVYSEPGRGSAFKFYLPRIEGVKTPSPTPVPQSLSAPRSGTVLLVEDDNALRRAIARMLREHGFKVLVAGRAEDAVAVFEGHSGVIDLVLTDVIMPGRSGPELAAELSRRRPNLRIVFMSGYPRDAMALPLLDEGIVFLQKPFASEDLVRALRAALE